MSVKNDIVVLDEVSYERDGHVVLNPSIYMHNKVRDPHSKAKFDEWKEAKHCKHEKEPWIMTMIDEFKSSPFGVVEHVMLIQPACDQCEDKGPLAHKGHEDFLGRK